MSEYYITNPGRKCAYCGGREVLTVSELTEEVTELDELWHSAPVEDDEGEPEDEDGEDEAA